MTNQILQTSQEALTYLKEGYILRVVEKPILLKMKQGTLYSSSVNWTVRIPVADFYEIFRSYTFSIVTEEDGISNEKDEEYYKWRNQYL